VEAQAIAGLVLGLALGAGLGWLAARARLARLETELAHERQGTGEKLALVAGAERTLKDAFQALSAEALRSNNQSFLDLARAVFGELQRTAAGDLETRRQAVDELVRPLRESLEKVDAKLQAVEKERAGAYAALTEQVQALALGQQRLQGETASLVRALRAPAVRGTWGEIQLKRVVEMAGMLDHCDFHEQPTVATDAGRLRPDLLVRLPGGRNIVVDAKVPLAAYLDALEAADDGARAANLQAHARQVREHMTKLGAKAYWDQFQPTPELVVMFLPGEAFFSAALEQDPALIEYGVDKRVVVASPTTLIALLRAVAYGWQQERITENARQIWSLGQSLYDRIRVMAGHFEALRRALDNATDAYNRAVRSLETRVLVAARRFKDLGAGTQDDIPVPDLVDRAAREPQLDQLALRPEEEAPEGEEGEEPAARRGAREP
jgi:DNA recombination protein RmuC